MKRSISPALDIGQHTAIHRRHLNFLVPIATPLSQQDDIKNQNEICKTLLEHIVQDAKMSVPIFS